MMQEITKHKQNIHCLLMHALLIFKDGCRKLKVRTQNCEYLESQLAGEYECLKSKNLGTERRPWCQSSCALKRITSIEN